MDIDRKIYNIHNNARLSTYCINRAQSYRGYPQQSTPARLRWRGYSRGCLCSPWKKERQNIVIGVLYYRKRQIMICDWKHVSPVVNRPFEVWVELLGLPCGWKETTALLISQARNHCINILTYTSLPNHKTKTDMTT